MGDRLQLGFRLGEGRYPCSPPAACYAGSAAPSSRVRVKVRVRTRVRVRVRVSVRFRVSRSLTRRSLLTRRFRCRARRRFRLTLRGSSAAAPNRVNAIVSVSYSQGYCWA